MHPPPPKKGGGGANCIKCQQIFKWETGKFLSEGVRVTGSIDELVAYDYGCHNYVNQTPRVGQYIFIEI